MWLKTPARTLIETSILYTDEHTDSWTNMHMDVQTGCFYYIPRKYLFWAGINIVISLFAALQNLRLVKFEFVLKRGKRLD